MPEGSGNPKGPAKKYAGENPQAHASRRSQSRPPGLNVRANRSALPAPRSVRPCRPSAFTMPVKIEELLSAVSRRLKTDIYLVGGPVRDALLGRPITDWDFVCRRARPTAAAVGRRLSARLIVL